MRGACRKPAEKDCRHEVVEQCDGRGLRDQPTRPQDRSARLPLTIARKVKGSLGLHAAEPKPGHRNVCQDRERPAEEQPEAKRQTRYHAAQDRPLNDGRRGDRQQDDECEDGERAARCGPNFLHGHLRNHAEESG